MLQLLQRLLYPVVWTTSTIGNGLLLSCFGVDLHCAPATACLPKELRSVVRESAVGMPKNRQNMLLGILTLSG